MSPARWRGPVQLTTVLNVLGAGRAVPPDLAERSPVRVGAVRRAVDALADLPPQQVDGTTCGAACLVVVAAAADPRLLGWIVDGAPTSAGDSPAGRFARLQRGAHRASTRRALAGLPWPRAFGTPPWGLAAAASAGGLRFVHRLVDDSCPEQSRPLIEAAVVAAHRGLPVFLYTGGDTAAGLAAAVPRHVVLLSSPDGHALEIYEPSSGRLHPVTAEDVLDGGARRDSYGGWSHLVWIVLPRTTSPSGRYR